MYPLTEAQEGLWFFQRLHPGNPILNTGQYLELTGPLDVDRFQQAVARAVAEAPALALSFRETAAGVVQRPGAAPRPGFHDLSAAADPAAEALRLMGADSALPRDPARGGLATLTLYRLGPGRHFWYQRIHHLVTDGYGIVLLTNRVAQLYADPGAGLPLTPLERAIDEDAAYRGSARRTDDGLWWRGQMQDLPAIAGLAPAGAPAAVSGSSFLRETQILGPELLAGLRRLSETAGTGWPDVLTALTAAYCQRFAGGGEAVVGVPFMGRLGSKAARTATMLMNVLPLRLAPDEEMPLPDWLKSVGATLAAGRRHGRYRSEQLRRDLGRIGGDRRLYGPLVNVQPFDTAPKIPGLDVKLHILGAGAVDDITFTFRGDAGDALVFEVDANPALYPPDAVRGHSQRLAAFLAAAVRADRLADVPTVSPEESRWLELSRRATRQPLPEVTLLQLIEAQLAATPGATALRSDGASMDHAELDRRSAALAARLRAMGAGPDRIVAVALERGFALPIALLAVLRAGAAYLPLDPAHPDERLDRILRRAEPVTVLTDASLAPRFPGALILDDAGSVRDAGPGADDGAAAASVLPGKTATDLGGTGSAGTGSSGGDAGRAAVAGDLPGPDHLAYVIFTSGSTGEPKGVMVSHRAIVNRLLWMRDFYGFDASDRILQKTPATFDVSVWEFFLPMICGATLVMAPPGAHRDPSAIAALIRAEAITTLHFVPSMLSAFLAAPASQGLSLRRVFCSGEELTPAQRQRFHQRITGELHNLYGPTEAAVDVSFWPAGPEDHSVPVPIGHPVWNTALEVLDERLRELPDGVAGQLYLGGVQLARGYLGRPDLTAERFIPDPRTPGGRLYATGDMARRLPGGEVVYLGRNDHQVKIRGLRIELGEVEAALMDHPATREAVAMARDGRLLAWVVPPVDPAALKAHLAERLPDYMVPAAITGLEALPVTANGKLDRAALPAPALDLGTGREPGPDESRLALIYAEVLGLAEVPGPEADFFDLGGDSLSAVRLALRIEEEFGRDPGLGTVFDRPVLSALAAAIATGGADHGLGPLLELSPGPAALPGEGPAPLALIHPAGGLGWGYRLLAAALPGRRIVALQAPMLDPASPMPESLAALAQTYAGLLESTAPGARWHLAGWSVGGIIAQAMAAAMARDGAAPGLLALLDSYPADVWRDDPEPDEATVLRALLAVAGFDPEAHPELQDRAGILAFLKGSGSALGSLPEPALDGVMRTVAGLNRLVRGHHHSHYPGRLTHVTAALDHQGTGLHPGLWQEHAAALDPVPVPFRHPELTSPEAVALIAPLLAERMDRIDREAGPCG